MESEVWIAEVPGGLQTPCGCFPGSQMYNWNKQTWQLAEHPHYLLNPCDDDLYSQNCWSETLWTSCQEKIINPKQHHISVALKKLMSPWRFEISRNGNIYSYPHLLYQSYLCGDQMNNDLNCSKLSQVVTSIVAASPTLVSLLKHINTAQYLLCHYWLGHDFFSMPIFKYDQKTVYFDLPGPTV